MGNKTYQIYPNFTRTLSLALCCYTALPLLCWCLMLAAGATLTSLRGLSQEQVDSPRCFFATRRTRSTRAILCTFSNRSCSNMHVGMALKPRSLWQLGKRNSEVSFENLLSCDWLQTLLLQSNIFFDYLFGLIQS